MLRILLVSHNQDLIANIVNDAGITTTQEIITLKARRQKSSVFLVNREPQMDAHVLKISAQSEQLQQRYYCFYWFLKIAYSSDEAS